MSRRTIIVGDIHGCYDELAALLDKVGAGADDSIIATGDLIVKGEGNRRVLDLFMSDARFSAVLGNHDRAILRYWRGETAKLKPKQELCRRELENGARERYAAYLASLPTMIKVGAHHLVVHAGVRPGVALSAQSIEDLTELRTLGDDRTDREGVPWYEVYEGERMVLFGHWPQAVPRRGRRAIGLDTGCVYGYHLTAYTLETGEFTQVKARHAYDAPRGRVGGGSGSSWWRRIFTRL